MIPEPTKAQRKVAREPRRRDQQVAATVAVGIDHLHPGICKPKPCWRIAHVPWKIKPATASVAPVAYRAIHLQNVRQAMAKEIDELVVWLRQGRCRHICTGEREEIATLWLESRIAELQRGQRLSAP